MSIIQLNGAAAPLAAGTTVADLVAAVTGRAILPTGQPADGGRLGVAVARNADIVPRSQWSATAVVADDDVEIVTAVQGG
ncbi:MULTISPECIES: sulfur carrier protein ThiS [unclassified Arthrobacter]|uniref:sulfur carrier protein ThiS n=1 Tax=unclassified Arthrobacter TaxID=235627 RepID=UPI00159E429A|nr:MULTISPECIES: sulfur carrier protein ThiS [unclassified Arthrobacter]MCQ9165364.1 sulfur carrier protein ThiS [Arthrobacter sp. STN4]NVM99618.1 sulfur carrier protein ThiS [Arthrobacter sp. SDTb3-6]